MMVFEDLTLPIQKTFHEVEVRRNQVILTMELIKSLVQCALTCEHQVGQTDSNTSGNSGQTVHKDSGVFAPCFFDERNCI